jgi:hypothetical protein
MKHIILTGDPAQVNVVLKTVMDKLGKAVKSMSFVQSVICLPPPAESGLKILGQQPQQIQFANVANVTILYQLPNDAELPESEFLPQS